MALGREDGHAIALDFEDRPAGRPVDQVRLHAGIHGRWATAGSLVYSGTFGHADKTPNAYLTQVIALSDLPVQGLVSLIVNGDAVTYDPDASIETIGGHALGRPTASAPAAVPSGRRTRA